MRMIYNVIDQIIEAIPEEEKKNYGRMLFELDNIRNASLYQAPEQMPDWFKRVANILNIHLGDPKGAAWKERIVDIFADRLK